MGVVVRKLRVCCTADGKGKSTWGGISHVIACPKLPFGAMHTRHTAGWRLAGQEPKTDSPPGLNVYKYKIIKACQHDFVSFPLIHTLSSYGDYAG